MEMSSAPNEIRNRKHKKHKQPCEKITEKPKHYDQCNDLDEKKTFKFQTDSLNGQLIQKENVVEAASEETSVIWEKFEIKLEIDLISQSLFIIAFLFRIYNLDQPRNIIFDELHYGKYVTLYLKRTFFFDSHPPLGKQLIAGLVYLTGFDGNFKFDRIGSSYADNVPLFVFRFIPAFLGSLLVPLVYNITLALNLSRASAALAAVLVLFDNSLLTQSRFILMESILLFFSYFGIFCVLRFGKTQPLSLSWFFWLSVSFISFTCAICTKFVGVYSYFLGLIFVAKKFCEYLRNKNYADYWLVLIYSIKFAVITFLTVSIYLLVFYVHLKVLYKAGPHDSVMTSAFQASLEGGLASITKGQPLYVSHGSQVTLRHTHGRTCWLHSHPHVYPVRYPDKRGSSHQQQVTCYSFKDVNNWWIVKRPEKNSLVVDESVDAIKHGDIIQLVHGITSRALNAHDVAAPMSPQCQEVSCYIDYNVSMPAQNLWKVDIINKDQLGEIWQTIQSHVRLIHVKSGQALRFSGRQLPDWGFHQHEVVTDKIVEQDDTIWNVEEHRYTKAENQKDRERQLLDAEMIPTAPTKLSFWSKFIELQRKMMFSSSSTSVDQSHMYSSEPWEWPFMTRGIAYWVANDSNAQIHLLGNLLLWYSCVTAIFIYTLLLIFYLLRRSRNCFDLPQSQWCQFTENGQVLVVGYLVHYLPYFFVERTMFLHHYLPAFIFKVLIAVCVVEHIYFALKTVTRSAFITKLFVILVGLWVMCVALVFFKFLPFSYGMTDLSMEEIISLRWKDTWDFILHKNTV